MASSPDSPERAGIDWRNLLDRYGPTLAVVAALALVVVVLPSNVDDQRLSAGGRLGEFDPGEFADGEGEAAAGPDGLGGIGGGIGGGGTNGGGGGGGEGGTGGGGGGGEGGTGGGGGGGGGSVSSLWGPGKWPAPGPDTKCREDGFLPGFAAGGPYFQTVCVPEYEGFNGGATALGVTEKKITVVRYIGDDEFLKTALQGVGAGDSEATAKRVDEALIHYFNNHTETFGREVVMVDYPSSGTEDTATRDDARDLIAKHKPFAVFPSVLTGANDRVLAEEVAAHGITCICTTSEPSAFYKRLAPYVFGTTLPTLDLFYAHVGEYVGKRLRGRPAEWAGASVPPIPTNQRKYGLIYNEGDPPSPLRSALAKKFRDQILPSWGVKLTHMNSYKGIRDAGQNAPNLMAQHKDEEVTTLICICDGLSPIFFTQAATDNQYFPEHFNPGMVLMDTTFTGRLYDKTQWRNSFGISPLWVFFSNVRTSSGYRAYHHARPSDAHGAEGVQINVRQAPIQGLFIGIQYAGPILTPENFALGLYRAPRTGGTPKAPLIYWTPEAPTGIKDFTEIWWDEDGVGVDETGKNGTGILVKARGGKRYALGQWPNQKSSAFDPNGIVYTSDTPPETFDHDADGHSHGLPGAKDRDVCRSC